jgi:hypothetical protein
MSRYFEGVKGLAIRRANGDTNARLDLVALRKRRMRRWAAAALERLLRDHDQTVRQGALLLTRDAVVPLCFVPARRLMRLLEAVAMAGMQSPGPDPGGPADLQEDPRLGAQARTTWMALQPAVARRATRFPRIGWLFSCRWMRHSRVRRMPPAPVAS